MSAASVAVVVTSGERHEGKARMVLFAGDPCLIAVVCALVQKGAKYSFFPFLYPRPNQAFWIRFYAPRNSSKIYAYGQDNNFPEDQPTPA